MGLEFRRQAMEEPPSIEKINDLARIVSPNDWVILYTLIFAILALFSWGIFGSIETRVTGEGILLAHQGGIFDAIAPSDNTKVISILVKPGDRVQKGQVLALLKSPDLEKKRVVQDKYLKQLQNNYQLLNQEIQGAFILQTKQINKTKQILMNNLKRYQNQLNETKNLLNRKKQLLKLKLITLENQHNTLTDFYQIQQKIAETKNALIKNEMMFLQFKENWQSKHHEMQIKLIDANRDLQTIEAKIAENKQVISPINGAVTNVHISLGNETKNGEPLISIANIDKGIDALLYVPADKGQLISVGAKALISSNVFQKEEFGSMISYIESINNFPSTPESMMAALHNQNLVNVFSKIPTLALRARIVQNPKTFSGFAWTSGKGPKRQITPGMIVNADIIVKKQAPITLIIPAFKYLLSME